MSDTNIPQLIEEGRDIASQIDVSAYGFRNTAASVIRDLCAALEVLTTPPTEDERERLKTIIFAQRCAVRGVDPQKFSEDDWEEIAGPEADAITEAGFRDRSISDREVAAKAWG